MKLFPTIAQTSAQTPYSPLPFGYQPSAYLAFPSVLRYQLPYQVPRRPLLPLLLQPPLQLVQLHLRLVRKCHQYCLNHGLFTPVYIGARALYQVYRCPQH
jgi:hypothetical protein